MVIAAVVLAFGVAMIVLQIWQDRRTFPCFKAMTETAPRQATMRYWLIDSFLRYGVAGVIALFLLGRPGALAAVPADMAAARDQLLAGIGLDPAGASEMTLGMSVALVVGLIAGAFIPLLLQRKKKTNAPVVIGDIAALLPRNGREMGWMAAMSINAGVSEEIFFRLVLPFAAFTLWPDARVAFLIAALLFGAVHAYQGVVGIVATFVVGLLLTFIYLATGQIWLAIALHALMDLRTLVLVPLLTGSWRAMTEEAGRGSGS